MRLVPGRAIGLPPWNGSPDAGASRCPTGEPPGPAGSSRSTTPSSAPTSVASATAGFVIDAQRNSCSRGPRSAITSPRRTTATANAPAPQPSTCASASTRRDTSPIDRRLISSGSPYEQVAGFSRAVVVGPHAPGGGGRPGAGGDSRRAGGGPAPPANGDAGGPPPPPGVLRPAPGGGRLAPQ